MTGTLVGFNLLSPWYRLLFPFNNFSLTFDFQILICLAFVIITVIISICLHYLYSSLYFHLSWVISFYVSHKKHTDGCKLVEAIVLCFLTGFFKPFTFISYTYCLSQSSFWCILYLLCSIINSLVNVSD